MGCVLPAGLRQAPARQAGIRANLPKSVPAVTVNKGCGSGMKTILMASDQIRSGSSSVVVAGGIFPMKGSLVGFTPTSYNLFTNTSFVINIVVFSSCVFICSAL